MTNEHERPQDSPERRLPALLAFTNFANVGLGGWLLYEGIKNVRTVLHAKGDWSELANILVGAAPALGALLVLAGVLGLVAKRRVAMNVALALIAVWAVASLTWGFFLGPRRGLHPGELLPHRFWAIYGLVWSAGFLLLTNLRRGPTVASWPFRSVAGAALTMLAGGLLPAAAEMAAGYWLVGKDIVHTSPDPDLPILYVAVVTRHFLLTSAKLYAGVTAGLLLALVAGALALENSKWTHLAGSAAGLLATGCSVGLLMAYRAWGSQIHQDLASFASNVHKYASIGIGVGVVVLILGNIPSRNSSV